MLKYYSKKEYQQIANIYNLGQVNNITPMHIGYGGSVKARVSTSLGEFVVSKNILSNKKDGVSKSKESLQYEIDMLNSVRGMPVPVFKISINENYIEKFKDGWITVYDFISGDVPKKVSPSMAYGLGKFLGEFHSKSSKFKKEVKSRRRFYDLNPRVMRKMHTLANKQTNPKLKSIVKEIENGVIENHPPKTLPVGPIHVDIGHNNELFQGEKLSGIIDFGNFYRGPFMVDIGKTIMWNCCKKGELDIVLFKNFMRGYLSKRRLNKIEVSYIKKSILYAIYSHIWVDLYHVPIKYVPESWPLFLIKTFIPVAKKLEKTRL